MGLLKSASLPAQSELATLSFPPDTDPEIMAGKISEVLKRELDLIQHTPGFNLSSTMRKM
ncbi:hypothetical protein ATN83_p10122 (plasmid) [Raoultella ornithinolytica]|jgi:hypothetical protein|nr:hypothetical protein ATN83_p10122 [Raoultella ornithinolytica]